MNRATIGRVGSVGSVGAVRLALALALGTGAAVLSGCTPKIGDKCVLNTDCGSSGTLSCDTSMPGGYCTQFNCQAGKCQNNAACVEFLASVPGCPYDDYQSPSRTGRTFCLKTCQKDSDCRQSDGYVCGNPKDPPWSAQILDDNQGERVCIVGMSSLRATDSGAAGGPPPICMVGLGDAVAPPIDAGVVFETDGASADGGDGSSDAETDVSGESGDSASEDGAGAPDGSVDGAADGGAADAPDGD
jgi:hypothetical protein